MATKVFFYTLRPYDELGIAQRLAPQLDVEFGSTQEYPTLENAELAKGYDAISIITTPTPAEMIDAMKEETVRRLYSVRLRQNEEVKRERVASGMTENVGGDGTVKKRPTKVVKVGRNDLCPCGSGLKWKKCTCKDYHS